MLPHNGNTRAENSKKGAVPLGPYRYPGYPAEKNAMIECLPSDKSHPFSSATGKAVSTGTAESEAAPNAPPEF